MTVHAATAFAQAAIAGSVSDPSRAPIPDTLVEVSGPALIERTRTTTTDDNGRYRVGELRPGVYVVRFSSPGWRAHEETEITLTGSFTAPVDVTLTPEVSEAIRVSRDLPTVDVQSVRREVTIGGDLVASLPTARTYNAVVALVPGVVTNANDVVTGTAATQFPIHGGRTTEGRLLVDGLNVGSPPSGNSAASYVVDTGLAQEITISARGSLGESETAGMVLNVVPRIGGNALHGSAFAAATGERLSWDNLTPALIAQNLTATPLSNVYDISGGIGGAMIKDRLWYFATLHTGGSTRNDPIVHYNVNAANPAAWLYAPDLSRQAYSDRTYENASTRLTWKASPRHTVNGFADVQALCRTCTGATPGMMEPQRVSPEAVGVLSRPLYVSQVTWSSPMSDRLLLDAGFGGTFFGVGNFERSPNPTRDLVRVVEQCASGCPNNGGIPGLTYRSQDFSSAYVGSYLFRAALHRATSSGSLKIGYQHTVMTDDRTWRTNDQNLTYRLNDGVPNQLTQSISPWVNNARTAWHAVFVQHRWTGNRLTVQSAMRIDRAWSWFPEQREGPARFLPEPLVFAETAGVDSYKDVSPRAGLAYDIFGSGATALKINVGRYLEGAGVFGTYANSNPTLRMPQTTQAFGTSGVTRAWTDANRNFNPDCDLMDPSMQDLRASGGDLCGVMSNARFGQAVLTNNFDPAILKGWGVRPSDWTLDLSIEHELRPGLSIAASYVRRWYDGFFVVDNLLVGPSDLTPFAITAPLDARLPGGGGYQVTGLYDVIPSKTGAVNNFVTSADRYGDWDQHFNGLDLTVSMQRGARLTAFAGTSTGQTVSDNCGVRAALPELSTTVTGTSGFGAGLLGSAVTQVSPYCHVAYGILTQLRGFVSTLVPGAEVQLSAAIQSKPGPMLLANHVVSSAEAAGSLGRPLSGNAPNVTVNVVAPGERYGERINELDLRVAKAVNLGRWRAMLALELYNTLNSSAPLSYNNTFVPGGTWPLAMTTLSPRFLKLAAAIDF